MDLPINYSFSANYTLDDDNRIVIKWMLYYKYKLIKEWYSSYKEPICMNIQYVYSEIKLHNRDISIKNILE